MTEQQYRVIACDNTKPHQAHTFRGQYQKRSLPGVYITETFQCEGIERSVPTTDEPRRVLMTHPHDGHGPDDTCLDCETKTSPHPPTREQIADIIKANFHAPDRAHPTWWIKPYTAADAVLALIQNGVDR